MAILSWQNSSAFGSCNIGLVVGSQDSYIVASETSVIAVAITITTFSLAVISYLICGVIKDTLKPKKTQNEVPPPSVQQHKIYLRPQPKRRPAQKLVLTEREKKLVRIAKLRKAQHVTLRNRVDIITHDADTWCAKHPNIMPTIGSIAGIGYILLSVFRKH